MSFLSEYRPPRPIDGAIFDLMEEMHNDYGNQWKFLNSVTRKIDFEFLRQKRPLPNKSEFEKSDFRFTDPLYRNLLRQHLTERLSDLEIRLVSLDEFIQAKQNRAGTELPWYEKEGKFADLGDALTNLEIFPEVFGISVHNLEHFEYLHPLQIIFYGEAIDRKFGKGNFKRIYQEMGRAPFTQGERPNLHKIAILSQTGFWYGHWFLFFDSMSSPFSGMHQAFKSFGILLPEENQANSRHAR